MNRTPDRPRAGYDGPTYYGASPVKPSSYGALVWSYAWLGGLAGSAQVVAWLADLSGRPGLRGVVRQGRALAAWLPVLGAGLLIADLHTPQRFYNMVRIYRRTSPMSIGTYLLCTFGATSIGCAIAQAIGRPALARAMQLPAAAAGAGMSTYTGALLGATSTPLWSAEPRLLTGRFAASALATGASALALGACMRGSVRQASALQGAAVVATLTEHALRNASEQAYRERAVGDVLDERGVAALGNVATWLGVTLPLVCLAADLLGPRRSRALVAAGAVGVLAGGLAMRAGVFRAGNLSAQRPRDAFALTVSARDTALRRGAVSEAMR